MPDPDQNEIKTVGFIGLGVMGEAMCRNIVRKGSWTVIVHDLNAAPLERLAADGADVTETTGELAAAADLLITCLPGGRQVEELVLGSGGLLAGMRPGSVLVDMSTSPPGLMTRIASAAQDRGIAFADAPVARTRQAAADGTLAIMVGGDDQTLARITPVLETMGTDIVHCGGHGAGQTVKILNNMVLFQNVAALAEAVELAERSGVDGRILLDTMSKGSGDSFALRNHAIKSLLPRDYPERAFSVAYAAKDLGYALEMAETTGVDTPGARHVADLFRRAEDAGDADLYFPVIRRRLTE